MIGTYYHYFQYCSELYQYGTFLYITFDPLGLLMQFKALNCIACFELFNTVQSTPVYCRGVSHGPFATIAECDNYAFPVQVTYYLRIRVYVRTVTF